MLFTLGPGDKGGGRKEEGEGAGKKRKRGSRKEEGGGRRGRGEEDGSVAEIEEVTTWIDQLC